MPSPFPGMDPYLEGYLWPDVHHRLATEIADRLTPYLRPRYVARLEIYVVEDTEAGKELGIFYPDVEVVLAAGTRIVREPAAVMVMGETTEEMITTPPLRLPLIDKVDVRIAAVEIRDIDDNELITVIEIMSPVNKRAPGLEKYLNKRRRLHQGGIHLLEIDLLRRGTRPFYHPRLPDAPYFVVLTRAHQVYADIWPIQLVDPLPTVSVPLREPDEDVPLAIGAALAAIYERAAYDLSIDYKTAPPPPPLSAEEEAWVQSILT
jgi:hypothetical protein